MSSFIKSLLFNILETIVIFMIGLIFKLNANYIITLMLTFYLCRMLCGQPKHYKSAYKCFVWSTLTFTSVYALTDLHIVVVILLTIFTGFISTGKANIQDMFMWKGRETKYSDIDEFVKYNPMNTKLIEFENNLKNKDDLLFLVYKYRFKDSLKFSEICERLDIDNPRLVEKLDKIAFSIRLFCGI